MCQKIHSEDCNVDPSNRSLSYIRLGVVLKFMDICACLSIEKIAKSSCVTASMDHLVFSNDKAFSDGDVMVVEAQAVRCFNTSAEVVVRVMSNPSLSPNFAQTREKEVCFAHAFFIFVRLDKGQMPAVFPQTAVERQEHELAMERRSSRQSKKKLLSAARAAALAAADSETESACAPGPGPLAGVAADRSLLEYTHIVLPTHANHMGNTFGGQLMCWAEEVAVLAATLHVNTALQQDQEGSCLHMICPDTEREDGEKRRQQRLVPVPAESRLSFATVYVSALAFLAPSTVGDRISMRAQCCRSFGSVLEVEVTISTSDVEQRSVRDINTGHFCICCRESSDARTDVMVPPVLPATVEQRERHALSLQRMMLACTRSAVQASSAEDGDGSSQEFEQLRLATMLQMQASSIWNSCAPTAPTPTSSYAPLLSPSIEAECAADLALHDICGLLSALSTGARGTWESLPLPPALTAGAHDLSVQVRAAGGITKLCLRVTLAAPVARVAELILDMERRGAWDDIMAGRVVRQIGPDTELVWMGSVRGRVDYALLRCHRVLEDGRVAVASRSVLHPALPPAGPDASPAYVRCEVLPSGFLLTPVTEEEEEWGGERGQSTSMQYLLQFDARSAQSFAGEFDLLHIRVHTWCCVLCLIVAASLC
jgi:acyl-CoA hydrolase